MSARLEQIKATRAAFGKLYEALSQEQKSTADDIVLPTIGMGPGHGMGPWMMHNMF
jgi:hypothetical protein